jgi:tRNA A37 threonylcarbamoyladenosine synthetase subunit TsaC/SUA5/YrdC
MTDAAEIYQRIGHAVDLVLDGGNCGFEPTTVVDLAGPVPAVLRSGKGDPRPFQ